MKSHLHLLFVCAALCGFAERLNAQSLYFPPTSGDGWATTDPTTLGYCTAGLDSLDTFLEASNSKAFILLKDGKIVHERYFGTFTSDSLWLWNSAGKSLTAFIVGLAQQDGFLDINEPTSTYLGTGWTMATPQQEAAITVRNQLTMTTGLDDGVPQQDCTDPECLLYKADAGTRWAYHNGPYTLLDGVIEGATGESLNVYKLRKLRASTGITGVYLQFGWNNVHASTPRSMARFGLLMLAEGSWDGTPILTDTAYFRQMITPSQTINPSYGYLWWLNGQDKFRLPGSQIDFTIPLMPGLASDAYAALGKNGQIISVTPSTNEVWIRMGEAPDGQSALVAPLLASDIGEYLAAAKCTSPTSSQPFPTVSLSLKPNPASQEVTLTCGCMPIEIEVIDMLGRVSLSLKPAPRTSSTSSFNQTLSLASLQSGKYTVKVRCEEGKVGVQQLVVR